MAKKTKSPKQPKEPKPKVPKQPKAPKQQDTSKQPKITSFFNQSLDESMDKKKSSKCEIEKKPVELENHAGGDDDGEIQLMNKDNVNLLDSDSDATDVDENNLIDENKEVKSSDASGKNTSPCFVLDDSDSEDVQKMRPTSVLTTKRTYLESDDDDDCKQDISKQDRTPKRKQPPSPILSQSNGPIEDGIIGMKVRTPTNDRTRQSNS